MDTGKKVQEQPALASQQKRKGYLAQQNRKCLNKNRLTLAKYRGKHCSPIPPPSAKAKTSRVPLPYLLSRWGGIREDWVESQYCSPYLKVMSPFSTPFSLLIISRGLTGSLHLQSHLTLIRCPALLWWWQKVVAEEAVCKAKDFTTYQQSHFGKLLPFSRGGTSRGLVGSGILPLTSPQQQ